MSIIVFLNWLVLCYLILLSMGYIMLFILSVRDTLIRYQEVNIGDVLSIMNSRAMPPVTVMIAAHNEEDTILDSIKSVLINNYPNTYVLIVNDGSTDTTLEKLIQTYDLQQTSMIVPDIIKTQGAIKGYYVSQKEPRITVIDKEHIDKSDSLNIGVNACRTPLFITLDADSILEPDAISELVFYLITRPHAVAVGGAVYVLNGAKYQEGVITDPRMPYRIISGIQACEYMRSFLFTRAGWNHLSGALSFSGTATLFDYQAVVEVGGFDVNNPANDFEIIVRLHADKLDKKMSYQIGYTPAASCWTDVPDTLKSYWHQRSLWQIGTLRSLLIHKKLFFNPRFGIVGLFNYPFFLLGETFGPLVELLAYTLVIVSWFLGILDGYAACLFVLICFGFIVILTIASVFMSFITFNKYHRLKDIPWILLLVAIETFGFRQYTVICRVIATFRYFFSRSDKDSVASEANQT